LSSRLSAPRPLADPELFEAFVKEQDEQRSMAYRKKKNFRWSYLSAWPTWRKAQPGGSAP
jgi:hypothetical protein